MNKDLLEHIAVMNIGMEMGSMNVIYLYSSPFNNEKCGNIFSL
jgi:hypothetical protein